MLPIFLEATLLIIEKSFILLCRDAMMKYVEYLYTGTSVTTFPEFASLVIYLFTYLFNLSVSQLLIFLLGCMGPPENF